MSLAPLCRVRRTAYKSLVAAALSSPIIAASLAQTNTAAPPQLCKPQRASPPVSIYVTVQDPRQGPDGSPRRLRAALRHGRPRRLRIGAGGRGACVCAGAGTSRRSGLRSGLRCRRGVVRTALPACGDPDAVEAYISSTAYVCYIYMVMGME
jgi:hypothetical protein